MRLNKLKLAMKNPTSIIFIVIVVLLGAVYVLSKNLSGPVTHYQATEAIVNGTSTSATITSDSISSLINDQRTGLTTLKESPVLSSAAKEVLDEINVSMQANNAPNISPDEVVRIGNSHGVIVVGELFGARASTVQVLVTAWFNTPATKAQILNPSATTIGVAIEGGEAVVLLGR